MAGVDYVVKKYAIDEKRMGVTGYSYGGFLTNWIITHTSRFAAAIVGAGVSNWISDYGTADIPRTKESEFFGTPWENNSRELMIKHSHADAVHSRRGRYARPHRARGADVHSLAEAARPVKVHSLS
jgi:dipeptidyl aminopeptidase/acylaminoacyl peptidase